MAELDAPAVGGLSASALILGLYLAKKCFLQNARAYHSLPCMVTNILTSEIKRVPDHLPLPTTPTLSTSCNKSTKIRFGHLHVCMISRTSIGAISIPEAFLLCSTISSKNHFVTLHVYMRLQLRCVLIFYIADHWKYACLGKCNLVGI